MIVSIHQPGYLPWLGYFHKVSQSDVHVFFDTAQYEKNSWNNRNRIRTREGWMWLTVPVLSSGKFGQSLLETEIDSKTHWWKKHKKSLEANYSKARFFDKYWNFFEDTYNQKWESLVEINIHMIEYLTKQLGINVKFVRTSDLDVQGKQTDALIDICRKTDAHLYMSGIMGKDYVEEDKFKKENIELIYQDYVHPTYEQLYAGFEPRMSVVDLLFNHGGKSLDIILKDNVVLKKEK